VAHILNLLIFVLPCTKKVQGLFIAVHSERCFRCVGGLKYFHPNAVF